MTDSDSRPLTGKGPARFCSQGHEAAAHRHSLAHAIELAAQSLPADDIRPVNCENGLPLDSRTLLALLACCYAHQTYRSADVAATVRGNTTFCRRCLGASPDARAIRRFRRKNRESLHACLVAGLRLQAEQKLEAGLIRRICEASLEDEARRRIIMATFMDSMELDRDQTSDMPTEMGYLFAKSFRRSH
jgi:hypothetical protein